MDKTNPFLNVLLVDSLDLLNVDCSLSVTVKENGGVIVVAAGNQGGDSCDRSPACSDEVITVGATRWDQQRGDFSNYGDCISAWAPGQYIQSSFYDGSYGMKYGTSMAGNSSHFDVFTEFLVSQAKSDHEHSF